MEKSLAWTAFFIGFLMIIAIGLFIYKNNSSASTFKNEEIILKYNKSWTFDSKNLSFSNNLATIKIYLKTLNNEERIKDITALKNVILTESDNIIYEDEEALSNYNYSQANIMTEEDNNHSLITILKKNEKIAIVEYRASIDQFDMYLDNVIQIISELEIR